MKRFFEYLFAALALCIISAGAFAAPVIKMAGEKTDIVKWIDARFAKGNTPPFSFTLDGKSSDTFIRSWKWTRQTIQVKNPAAIGRQYTWTSKDGLVVVCDVTAWPDSKVVEWVLSFRNDSKENSARLADVKTADLTMDFPADGPVDVHYIEGNWMNNTDYCPKTKVFSAGDTLSFSPVEGRSTSGAFPYYNIESPSSDQGVIMAIGWAGTWKSAFRGEPGSRLKVDAGLKYLDSYLKPGEDIKTASVVLMFWSGDNAIDGNNKFRRFQMDHICRKRDGSPIDNKFFFSAFTLLGPNPFSCHSSITEDWAIALMNRHKFLGIMPEIFWLDAGWFTDSHKIGFDAATGNWSVDKERFPNGLKPVTDHAHKLGIKFMLWFEPERVVKNTWLAKEHPEWMLSQGPKPQQWENWMMLDLSKDEVCDWLCEYIGDMIEENGVDLYREDCNIMPGHVWAVNDEEGRTGMKEVHHINNHFRYWDYLLERFPDLVIDNCASGGKRMDWESMKRSYVFWQDDYIEWNDVEGLQTENYGLNHYIPIHGTGTRHADDYTFRSAESAALALNWEISDREYTVSQMQRQISELKSIRDYYLEDYYPLSGEGESLVRKDIWMAYQLHRKSDESGFVMAFRRSECKEASYEVKLCGLDPARTYVLTNADSGEVRNVSGKELSEGLVLELSEPKSSLLLYYHAE